MFRRIFSPRSENIFIMTKHLFAFLAAFVLGTVIALAVRSVWFKPYVDHSGHPAAPDYQPMVTNPAAPASDPHAGHKPAAPAPAAKPQTTPAADPHAGHGAITTPATVNTICAICGMDVDTSIKPATYQGKLVGFGCRMCPPRFAADPERYGPSALENKVLTN
jgi:hypothetical protein